MSGRAATTEYRQRHGHCVWGRPYPSTLGAVADHVPGHFHSGLDVSVPGIHDYEEETIVNMASGGADHEANLPGQGQHAERFADAVCDRPDTYLVQGYLVTDPEALAQMRIPDGETVVEVPKRLMKYLPPEERQYGEGHS